MGAGPGAAKQVQPTDPIDSSAYSLSIWAPFDPPTEMLFNAAESTRQVQVDSGGAGVLMERVYVWSGQEHPLIGVVDIEARARLQAKLDSLKISGPCQMHTIGDLQSLVDEARGILGGPMVTWGPSSAPAEPYAEASPVNSLLAFTKHLEWLIAIFKDVPNTWVSIR